MIAEEVDVRNIVDRVDTMGTVFLGLTVGCARCHDHKYDPLGMKEYYQLLRLLQQWGGEPAGWQCSPASSRVVPTSEQGRNWQHWTGRSRTSSADREGDGRAEV